MIRTFQDFEAAPDKMEFILSAIGSYKGSDEYKMALAANEYDAQRNITITNAVKTLYSAAGVQKQDDISSNNKIASNFFNRLNTQRCMYSLGGGISFIDPKEASKGKRDTTKERLGKHFDHTLKEAGYHALIHGRSYLFWDMDSVYEFTMTEFVPLEDENDGSLRAGIRFWQLNQSKPLNVVLYEEDGYTKYRSGKDGRLEEVQPKRAYKVTYHYTDAGDTVSIDEENYIRLPVVRMYASRLKQSTLVGMRAAIDAYDLIKSGFANDVMDCAEVYWIVENYGGMDQKDLAQFLDRIKLNHIANADTQSGGAVRPYTQDIPYNARQAALAELRSGLYEGFGALDVHVISAGATNDHIDAAYQPLDENASDFEHWVSDAIVQLLELQGIEDTPVFRRNKISNQPEQVSMLVQEAEWLDSGTVVRKMPNLTPEEAEAAIEARRQEDMERMGIAIQAQQGIVPEVEDEGE
jgi:hypothetical protein